MSGTALALASTTALAADPSPIGDWLVKEGYAIIRIDNCAGKMWGIVAWEKVPGIRQGESGSDEERSPDPRHAGSDGSGADERPGKWEGEIYNSKNGKMYSANISLADENTLDLEGCLYPNLPCARRRSGRG